MDIVAKYLIFKNDLKNRAATELILIKIKKAPNPLEAFFDNYIY